MPTALIYGAGRMGTAAGWALQKIGFTVDYADLHPGHTFCVKGATDAELTSLFRGYDVVLGTAGYQENLRLTERAIAARTHFCDLGGNNSIVDEQLALTSEAERAGVFVIPDCGLAPGWAGLLAAQAIEIFNGRADSVKIRVGGIPVRPVGPLGYQLDWSVNGLINEYLEPCEVLQNGFRAWVPALEDCEPLAINQTLYEAFNTSGGLSTLGRTFEGQVLNMDYKTVRYPGHRDKVALLRDLGLFEGSARSVLESTLRQKLAPTVPDKVVVKVSVGNGQMFLERDFEIRHDGRHTAMAIATGYAIASVAQMLASGRVGQHTGVAGGVLPGERSLPLTEYFDCLSRMVGTPLRI